MFDDRWPTGEDEKTIAGLLVIHDDGRLHAPFSAEFVVVHLEGFDVAAIGS